jgi:hypothetical protein
MINDNVNAKGYVDFKLYDENGNLKESDSFNLVVNTGLAFITERMVGNTPAVMSHMALGTNATAAAAANTALGAEVGRISLSGTTRVTTTATNDSVQFSASFGPGTATGAITEAGVFNASSGGTMIARTVFPVINKGALDTLAITWKIVIV